MLYEEKINKLVLKLLQKDFIFVFDKLLQKDKIQLIYK